MRLDFHYGVFSPIFTIILVVFISCKEMAVMTYTTSSPDAYDNTVSFNGSDYNECRPHESLDNMTTMEYRDGSLQKGETIGTYSAKDQAFQRLK